MLGVLLSLVIKQNIKHQDSIVISTEPVMFLVTPVLWCGKGYMLTTLTYMPTPSTTHKPGYMPVTTTHMPVVLRTVVAMQEGGVKAEQQQVVKEHPCQQDQISIYL